MRFTVSMLVVTAASFAVAGCSGPKNEVSDKAIVGDLSPEMHGLVETPARANANMNITADFNSRMFYDDIGRVLYTDNASRLTPFPGSGATGMPR